MPAGINLLQISEMRDPQGGVLTASNNSRGMLLNPNPISNVPVTIADRGKAQGQDRERAK
jgi:hypothetical protein